MPRLTPQRCAWAVLAACLLGGPVPAQLPDPIPQAIQAPPISVTFDARGGLQVPLDGTASFTMGSGGMVCEVVAADDKVVQVAADSSDPRAVTLTGKTAGQTRVTVIDELGNSEVYPVTVGSGHGQQVQLDVMVALVDVTRARERGFSLEVIGKTAAGRLGFGGQTPGGSKFGIVPAKCKEMLESLHAEGVARILADPKLAAQSGRPARLNFENIGVQLGLLPIVYPNGQIYLEVEPRVRGTPDRDWRSFPAQIEMKSGQTCAVTLLDHPMARATPVTVPILGGLTPSGPLCKVKMTRQTEQELVVLVTPNAIVPITPRSELQQLSKLEVLNQVIEHLKPSTHVKVVMGRDRQVVLTGTVARAEDMQPIVRLVHSALGAADEPTNVINAMRVEAKPKAVQLDVMFAQVSRSEACKRGWFDPAYAPDGKPHSVLSGLTGMAGSGQLSLASGIEHGLVPAKWKALLYTLRHEGMVKLLAEPLLITESEKPARFSSGGKVPVPGVHPNTGARPVDYEEVGTDLEFLPVVLENGKIHLEVGPRARNVNPDLGIMTASGSVPGFDEQSLRASVVMEPGQTYALTLLDQPARQASTTRIPVLADLPVIGPLFRWTSFTDTVQEQVILVTPHLVDLPTQGVCQGPQRRERRPTMTPAPLPDRISSQSKTLADPPEAELKRPKLEVSFQLFPPSLTVVVE